MNKQDFQRFAMQMRVMQEVYTPEKPISDDKVTIYFQDFKGWRIEDFEQACQKLRQTKTFMTFPTPAEIMGALQQEKSLTAWVTAREAISKYGSQMSIIFADAVIHDCIDALGGWPQFCHITDNEKVWKQKEFERLYKLMQNKDQHSQFLAGTHDEGMVDLRKGIEYLSLPVKEYIAKNQIAHNEPKIEGINLKSIGEG